MPNANDIYIVDFYTDKDSGVLVKVYEPCTVTSEHELKIKKLTKDFIARVERRWPEKFKFDLTRYVSPQSLVTLTCKKHLRDFKAYAMDVSRSGDGCPECLAEEGRVKCSESFRLVARSVHGDKYDYTKSIFENNRKRVIVLCNEHGPFKVTPELHVKRKVGCSRCADKSTS